MSEAILYKKVQVPEAFRSRAASESPYRGDLRIGDLTGNGVVDFVVYRSVAGIKPSFVAAFTIDGEPLWSAGDPDKEVHNRDDGGTLKTVAPSRPGPVVVHDIDGDGAAEVLCLMIEAGADATSQWRMDDMEIVILDGRTGKVKRRQADAAMRACHAYAANGELVPSNYVHQRLLIANFRGTPQPQDFLVKLGCDLLAYDDHLNLLWSYRTKWGTYPDHAAYIPAVGDLDRDGRDEVNGGHFVLDHDGKPIWERFVARHNDAVLIDDWDGRPRAIVSGHGTVVDDEGRPIISLGPQAVPHGQEVRCGNLRVDLPGRELVIRYEGHRPKLMVVGHEGRVLTRFEVDPSPNETGLEIVRWLGEGKPDLIYAPAALYDGYGRKVVTFPNLPPPSGGKMGWYHCFPADVCGDEREEVVLYDPYTAWIYIYTPLPLDQGEYHGYVHTARQYNARLMD